MAYDREKRRKFVDYLRVLAVKCKVRQVDIARAIGKTRQHVSHIFNGKIIFMGEQFRLTSDFLRQKGASDGELAILNRLFVEAKSSMELQKINLDAPIDPIKQIIIENLDHLSPSELVKIHKEIEAYKFNHLKEADKKSTES
jgi:predicted transcriptional regulator